MGECESEHCHAAGGHEGYVGGGVALGGEEGVDAAGGVG